MRPKNPIYKLSTDLLPSPPELTVNLPIETFSALVEMAHDVCMYGGGCQYCPMDKITPADSPDCVFHYIYSFFKEVSK